LVDRYGERLRAVAPDAIAPEAARGAVAATVAAFGRLDVVVNNAGWPNVGSIERTPLEELEAQIARNLWGPIRVAHAALPVMRAQRAGHIVQLSMVDGRRADPSLGAYQTTARGLEGFSEALAAEVAPRGIRVTIVEAAHMGEDGPTGDLGGAAQAILRVVAEEHPPLRMALGGDAVTLAEIGACSLRCEQYAR
jgi:NAD(P)-dependent dehydrogenase (short-subunit alcohol dehydrogenase family)